MNDVGNEFDTSYEIAQKEGKKEIGRSWQRLRPETRAWLVKSGHYTGHGSAAIMVDTSSDVENLEYSLGLINHCIAATLPQRSDVSAPIPPEASSSEVKSALSSLMYLPYGQDPVFLRRALLALRSHELACLLCILPPEKVSSTFRHVGTLVFCVFCIALLVVSPAILAGALVAIVQANYGDTVMALYALGFIAWMFNILRGLGKDATKTKDEQAYWAWSALNLYQSGDWTAAGAGALAYFEQMLRQGVQVPAIAFDISEGLKANLFKNSADSSTSSG
ncbi:MAG: hypothetical protein JWR21_2375 [Herminiimonas sp.]|nr:hypothetical protein [Herminiimonas sp.]